MKSDALPEVRSIPAAEFKAKCLQLMDELGAKPLTLIITKRGRPVMQASAPTLPEASFRSIIGRTPGVRITHSRAAVAEDLQAAGSDAPDSDGQTTTEAKPSKRSKAAKPDKPVKHKKGKKK